MAYIIEVIYEDGTKEVLPIWSAALSRELLKLKESNKDILVYRVINDNPIKEECEYFDSLIKRTKYSLPKEYRQNRKRRTKDE